MVQQQYARGPACLSAGCCQLQGSPLPHKLLQPRPALLSLRGGLLPFPLLQLSLPGAEHATVPTAQGLSAGHMVGLAGAGRLPVALALKGEDGHEGVARAEAAPCAGDLVAWKAQGHAVPRAPPLFVTSLWTIQRGGRASGGLLRQSRHAAQLESGGSAGERGGGLPQHGHPLVLWVLLGRLPKRLQQECGAGAQADAKGASTLPQPAPVPPAPWPPSA